MEVGHHGLVSWDNSIVGYLQVVAREDKGILGVDYNKSPKTLFATSRKNTNIIPQQEHPPHSRQVGRRYIEARDCQPVLMIIGFTRILWSMIDTIDQKEKIFNLWIDTIGCQHDQ
jgi:hypothetical protein